MGSVVGFPPVDPSDALIGGRLRRWRDRRHAEAGTLAQALDLSPEALRRVEAGRGHLSSLQMAAATTCLHLPLWALVSDTPTY